MSTWSGHPGYVTFSSWALVLSLCLVGGAVLAQADEDVPQAEKDFGKIAAQAEWLKSPPLPDWTSQKRISEQGVDYLIAGTAPVMSAADAEAELDREMAQALKTWIRERFSTEVAENLEIPIEMIRGRWMVNHLPVPCMMELPSSQPGNSYPMYRSFSQLAMTENVVEEISELWTARKKELVELRQKVRLTQWTILSGAVMLVLATVHSFIRLQLLSPGTHARKLRWMLVTAVTAIVGLSIWLLNILT